MLDITPVFIVVAAAGKPTSLHRLLLCWSHRGDDSLFGSTWGVDSVRGRHRSERGCAAAGVPINIASALLFCGSAVQPQHAHSHGADGGAHAHGGDGAGGVNLNLWAVFLHSMGDALTSVGVTVVALLIYTYSAGRYAPQQHPERALGGKRLMCARLVGCASEVLAGSCADGVLLLGAIGARRQPLPRATAIHTTVSLSRVSHDVLPVPGELHGPLPPLNASAAAGGAALGNEHRVSASELLVHNSQCDLETQWVTCSWTDYLDSGVSLLLSAVIAVSGACVRIPGIIQARDCGSPWARRCFGCLDAPQ